jgi:two-component system OmpR family response regulator
MEHAGYGVLVVDDDTAIRQVLVAFFTDEGYAVFEAPDGMSALERMRSSPRHLVVLLDWRAGTRSS